MLNHHRFLLSLIVAILFVGPFFLNIQPDQEGLRLSPSFPHIFSGDEPHYLIILSSLIEDGDADVRNNYDNAYVRQSFSAGQRFRGVPLDHHTLLVGNKQIVGWHSLFGASPVTDPALYAEKVASLGAYHERPFHPIGLPLLAAVFLWPLANSPYLDSGAIFLSLLASSLGLFYLYQTCKFYDCDRGSALPFFTTLCLAFATPLWHYSRTFFTEPYLWSFLIAAYYLFVVQKRNILPGVLLGCGVLMKLPFIVFPVVFALVQVKEGRWKELMAFSLPVSAALAVLLVSNWLLFGYSTVPNLVSPILQLGLESFYGNVFAGAWGLLFSSQHGLVLFSPFLVGAAFGLRAFYRAYPKHALFVLALTSLYFLLMASWVQWHGGYCYASRQILPIYPLLAIPLLFFLQSSIRLWFRALFYVLLCLSFIINLQSVLFFDSVWMQPPWGVPKWLIGW